METAAKVLSHFSGFLEKKLDIQKCPRHCIYHTKMQPHTKLQDNRTINNRGDIQKTMFSNDDKILIPDE